jgi:pimeloyl-ACP methyl ester carboxylesterase
MIWWTLSRRVSWPATPTLVIWGARDTFNPLSTGKGIETHLKSFGAPVEFKALDHARHFVAEDRSQDVARLVSPHIEACGAHIERGLSQTS